MLAIARVIRDLPRHWSATNHLLQPVSEGATDSKIRFLASPSYARETICAEPGAVGRIGITNTSLEVAHDCELALVSCSIEVRGLITPISLPLKDGAHKTKTDIAPGTTTYFDLFGAFLNPAVDWPERTFLWVPNHPYLPRMGQTRGVAVFSLTGSNFKPQLWRGTITIDQGDVRLTTLLPSSASV